MLARLSCVLAISLLGACEEDPINNLPDGPPVGQDTAPAGTSCSEPIHPEATPTLSVTGSVSDGSLSGNGNAIADVTVEMFRVAGGAALGTATTDVSGTYQLESTTGGTSIDGYVKLTKTGFREMRYSPRAPLFKATSIRKIPLFDTALANGLPATAGVTQDPANGIIIVRLTTCQTQPQSGFTVAVSPAGSSVVKYYDADGVGLTGTSTSSFGFAIVFNAPPGVVTVSATNGSMVDHPHAITSGPTWLGYIELSEM